MDSIKKGFQELKWYEWLMCATMIFIAARAMCLGFTQGEADGKPAWLYHIILVKIGGKVAWFDAFTLSIGIVVTILELLRYREQYIWWIVTDIVSVGMYIAHFELREAYT